MLRCAGGARGPRTARAPARLYSEVCAFGVLVGVK
jgi:hypothetical protein